MKNLYFGMIVQHTWRNILEYVTFNFQLKNVWFVALRINRCNHVTIKNRLDGTALSKGGTYVRRNDLLQLFIPARNKSSSKQLLEGNVNSTVQINIEN